MFAMTESIMRIALFVFKDSLKKFSKKFSKDL